MNAPAIRIDLVTREIGIIAEQLLALCGGDDRLYADMIEGETDINVVASRLVGMIENEEGIQAALEQQMAVRKERHQASVERTATLDAALVRLMKAAMLTTIRLPEATLSLRTISAKLKVGDPKAVPEKFCNTSFTPSMEKIGAAYNIDGALPNWLSIKPERPSLSIRRK